MSIGFNCCCVVNFTAHATKCSTSPYPGVTVSAASGGTVAGTGTTNASGDAVIALAAGTYTVTMTDPNGIVITFTQVIASSPVTATKNFVTSLSATVVNACGGAGLSGAALTFTQGSTTIGTATTNASGVGTCALTTNIPLTTVTVSAVYKGTTQTGSGTPTASCPNLCTISYKDTFTVTVLGCNNLPLPGATVTITPDGSTATTNGSGVATIAPTTGIANGTTVGYSASSGRFLTATGSFPTATPCSVTVALSPDTTNYLCIAGCAQPLALTLHGTDPQGAFTITYDPVANVYIGCALRNATGVKHFSGGACLASAATQTPIQFRLDPGSGTIAFFMPACTTTLTNDSPRDEACSTTAGSNPWPTGASIDVQSAGWVHSNLGSTVTCPTAFSFSVTYDSITANTAFGKVYSAPATFSLTE